MNTPMKLVDGPARVSLVRAPAFPLAAFLWPARGSGSQWDVLPLILMSAALFRCAVGLWGYSGYQRPPKYGDYEAQRHWMEVTTQLPVSQWYFHDLDWWGLDYPPLTAYHSWLLGTLGAWLGDPAWFALYTSRGCDDPKLKVFMRATVLVSEFLVYVPAAVVFIRRFSRLQGVSAWNGSMALAVFLMQPATMLIDHAHFQYNTVMLGLVLACMSSLLAGRLLWATVFIISAVAFKQMALYYFLPVFAYLLASCVQPRLNPARFIALTATAAFAAFAILLPLVLGTIYDHERRAGLYYDDWDAPLEDRAPDTLPLLPDGVEAWLDRNAVYYPVLQQLLQMVHRVFPFSRGLFEDKVANVWCAADTIFKLRRLPAHVLQRAALVATLVAAGLPSLVLFLKPRRELLPLALASSAWAFFLFSYQVHEKSVLLPLMPMTLLLAGRNGMSSDVRIWVGLANLFGSWTMYPRLHNVELAVPYFVLTLLWAYLLGLPPVSWTAYSVYRPDGNVGSAVTWKRIAVTAVHGALVCSMLLWHGIHALVPAPRDKPDLWIVANVGIGAAGFSLIYLWCLVSLVRESELLRGWRGGNISKQPRAESRVSKPPRRLQ